MTRARIRRLAYPAMTGAMAACLAAAPLDSADASTRNVAECMGSTTLTFVTHNLTISGAPDAFSFTGGGTCFGLVSGPASWSGNGTLELTASCTEVVVLSATGTMTGPNQSGPVTVDAAGPSVAQVWAFFGSPATQIVAAATFAWMDQSEISNCLGPLGTPTMTLVSAVVVGTT
jgi:hypothetical protein